MKLIVVEELQCALGGYINNKITDNVLSQMSSTIYSVLCQLYEEDRLNDIPRVIVEQSTFSPNAVIIHFMDAAGEIRPLKEWYR